MRTFVHIYETHLFITQMLILSHDNAVSKSSIKCSIEMMLRMLYDSMLIHHSPKYVYKIKL